MITAVFKIVNCGLTLTGYGFADHHTENLQIFGVNTWVNLELYGTLVRVIKNGWTHCTSSTVDLINRPLSNEITASYPVFEFCTIKF